MAVRGCELGTAGKLQRPGCGCVRPGSPARHLELIRSRKDDACNHPHDGGREFSLDPQSVTDLPAPLFLLVGPQRLRSGRDVREAKPQSQTEK